MTPTTTGTRPRRRGATAPALAAAILAAFLSPLPPSPLPTASAFSPSPGSLGATRPPPPLPSARAASSPLLAGSRCASPLAAASRRRLAPPLPAASADGGEGEAVDPEAEAEAEAVAAEVTEDSLTPSQIESLSSGSDSFLSNLRGILSRTKQLNKASLGKLGMSALLAYGFVSNVSGVVAVSCAWFIFSKRTGTSPLANKPAFLAIYAGFAVALNLIRPARFALSVAISPYFERIRKRFQHVFGVGPRGAVALTIVFVNLVGTCSLMAAGVGLASALSGVPVWAGR
ncbi:hypothetical protein ACHAWF_015347 [Thalassiosira exigua]